MLYMVRLDQGSTIGATSPAPAVRIRFGLFDGLPRHPIDLIADFVPVLGKADDAIILVAVLRLDRPARRIRPVRAHWTGIDDGFGTLCKAADLTAAEGSATTADPAQGRCRSAEGRYRQEQRWKESR